MSDPTLFHGIAVVIDDEIADQNSGIRAIQSQIEQEGCSVIGMPDIPGGAKLGNLKSASFFVVDWNLYAAPLGEDIGVGASIIPAGLKRENARRVIEFLKNLKQVRFAPVFIFTAGPTDEVISLLKKHGDLYAENAPSHIFVKTKAEVLDKGVFNILAESLQQTPSAYVLKEWERQYEQAKNKLFIDFYGNSVLWPLILWKTFQDDGVPPSVELGTLIGRNLLSRMTPFMFDLSSFDSTLLDTLQGDRENYRAILIKVLEGERFLPGDQLHMESAAPGDVFKDGKHYWVNIRPDCDCVARNSAEQDAIQLYLLEGSKLSSGQVKYDEAHGLLVERDTETIMFPMNNGATVSFRFKDLQIRSWGEIKAKRIGRLLAPFLTRLQQRYSAYLQRPGLTRVPEAVLDLPVAAVTSGVQTAPKQTQVAPAGVGGGHPQSRFRRLVSLARQFASQVVDVLKTKT